LGLEELHTNTTIINNFGHVLTHHEGKPAIKNLIIKQGAPSGIVFTYTRNNKLGFYLGIRLKETISKHP
jgi:hypothetical protein